MPTPGHVLCFGEILLRLSTPGGGALFQQPTLEANFGGAEANVAVALSRLEIPSAIVSSLPADAVGEAALDALRRHGVDITRIAFGNGRLGLYYLTPGMGMRASTVVYDRLNSLFAVRRDYDWPALLTGARWLHLSGITPAIGPEMAEISLAAMKAARAAGARVSFDGNFRASIWRAGAPIPHRYCATMWIRPTCCSEITGIFRHSSAAAFHATVPHGVAKQRKRHSRAFRAFAISRPPLATHPTRGKIACRHGSTRRIPHSRPTR